MIHVQLNFHAAAIRIAAVPDRVIRFKTCHAGLPSGGVGTAVMSQTTPSLPLPANLPTGLVRRAVCPRRCILRPALPFALASRWGLDGPIDGPF